MSGHIRYRLEWTYIEDSHKGEDPNADSVVTKRVLVEILLLLTGINGVEAKLRSLVLPRFMFWKNGSNNVQGLDITLSAQSF